MEKFEVEGKISYVGRDNPWAEYYCIDLPDGRLIGIGFDSEDWNGNEQSGIPEIGCFSRWNDDGTQQSEKRKCRITIEFLE